MSQTARKVIMLVRPWFWPPAMAAGIAGCIAAQQDFAPRWSWLVVAIALGPGICAFAEVINDVFDRELDAKGTRKTACGLPMSGGSGVLVQGSASRLRMAVICAAAAASVGVVVALFVSLTAVILIALGYGLAWMYSAPPVRAKGRGLLGVILQATGYGPVSFMLGVTCAGAFRPTHHVATAIMIGCWVGTVGLTADILDYADDAAQGSRTLVVRLGTRNARYLAVTTGTICLLLATITAVARSEALLWIPVACLGLLYLPYAWHLIHARKIAPAIHVLTLCLETLFPLALVI